VRLTRENATLLIIDVQERLMPVIDRADDVLRNVERLVRGCHILGVPALLTEQYVKGLGPTVEPVRRAFEETSGYAPMEKACFSAVDAVRASSRKQVIVAGVEAHVCVHQTVVDLLANGFEVALVADAVSSRTAENKAIALERLTREGAWLSSTEMVLFELCVVSGTDEFRAISRLVK
jgi:isochorismate hydrolase